jgi:hypothetical protein
LAGSNLIAANSAVAYAGVWTTPGRMIGAQYRTVWALVEGRDPDVARIAVHEAREAVHALDRRPGQAGDPQPVEPRPQDTCVRHLLARLALGDGRALQADDPGNVLLGSPPAAGISGKPQQLAEEHLGIRLGTV